jgi:hypothetical protein
MRTAGVALILVQIHQAVEVVTELGDEALLQQNLHLRSSVAE